MNFSCEPMFWIAMPIFMPAAPTSYSVPRSTENVCCDRSASPVWIMFAVRPALNLSVNMRAYVTPADSMPASNVWPVPFGWNAVVSSIGCIVNARACTANAPGIFFMWKT